MATGAVACLGLLLGLDSTAVGSLIAFGTAAIYVSFLLMALAAGLSVTVRGPVQGPSPMSPARPRSRLRSMISTTWPTPPLIYVQCDVPAGMTLDEWRRRPSEQDGRRSTRRRLARRRR